MNARDEGTVWGLINLIFSMYTMQCLYKYNTPLRHWALCEEKEGTKKERGDLRRASFFRTYTYRAELSCKLGKYNDAGCFIVIEYE